MTPVPDAERLIMAMPFVMGLLIYWSGLAVFYWHKDRKNPPAIIAENSEKLPEHEAIPMIAGISVAIFLFIQLVIQ